MNCKNCGKSLLPNDTFCRHCGTDNRQNITETAKAEHAYHPPVEGKSDSETQSAIFSGWILLSLMSFMASALSLYCGYDKMAHYHSSDYASLNVNAYVGGDAYNYIINGTYATAFFVLAVGLFLGAIGFLILHYMSRRNAEKG